MPTIEELEAELAALNSGPSEEELEAQRLVELERKVARARLIAKASASLGKLHDDFECVSFPDGRNVIIKRLPGSYYRQFEDSKLEDLTRDSIMQTLRQALWEMTPADLDAILERWNSGYAELLRAFMSLAGAGRIAIVGKPNGS
jgi:hypothetical protein